MRVGKYGSKLRFTIRAWGAMGVILILGAYFSVHAQATQEASWTSDTPILTDEIEYRKGEYGANEARKCASISISIAGNASPQQRCVTPGDNMFLDSQLEYIKVGSDQKYYRVHGMYGSSSAVRRTHVPFTNSLVTRSGYTMFTYSATLSIEKNILTSLSPMDNPPHPREYMHTHTPDFTLSDANGPLPVARGLAYSNNGRWLVVELMGIGLARIDLQDNYKTELVSTLAPAYYLGSNPSMVLAISDDGRSVAVGGSNTPFMLYEIDESCTKQIRQDEPLNRTGYNGCPGVSLREVSGLTGQYQNPRGLEFGDSSYELRYYASGGAAELCGADPEFGGCEEWRIIRAAGYVPSTAQLDYLALGDSYSSGEGDIERRSNGNTHYLEGTDVTGDYEKGIPEEKCHISSRSYPFVLQQSGAVGGDRVQSIACSGAKRVDVQGWSSIMGYGAEQKYQGQANRVGKLEIPRLEGFNTEQLQDIAIDNFISGRVQQIEFVELFRPRAITLTIGGNDLGFGDVLRACISQVAIYGTCDYATEEGRKKAGSLISNFRMQLVDVYSAIKEASPTVKLFVVGYPQFISGTQNFCGANSTLNRSDREFIVESVTYLNQVIKSAAHQAGAYYIDIEDALGEKILCTLTIDKYVNGLTAALQSASESFHPNKKGHTAIASRIQEGLRGQTLESFNDCMNNSVITCPGHGSSASPSVPEYLNPPSLEDKIVQAAELVRDTGNNIATGLRKGAEYVVRLNPFSAQPTAIVNISLHSDPVNLGDFEVAVDGSLDVSVMIPSNVPAGYHTLYVAGKTYSGEDIVFRQIVQVHGADPADIDENSVPDIHQPCGPFIASADIDEDLDGIDDACDPYIGENPVLYQWRFGNHERMHRGSPEDESQVYIERNIWASTLTGVTDDYDPDGDGWAIVGVSKDDQLDGINGDTADTGIDFEVLDDGSQGNVYSPIIYIHPNTQQCKAYRPTSLSRVEEGELRTLTIAEISNDKCPQELPDDNNPEQPTPDPSQGEGLFSRLKNAVLIIKEQIKVVLKAITSLVRTLFSVFR